MDPTGGSPDRMWITNNSLLSVSTGQTYLVSGYVKSATGNINLRGFFHKTGDMTSLYSDHIGETSANASGSIFSFYLTTPISASDGVFTLETDNPNISYEIDSLSVRRMNSVTKNTNNLELQIFSNTGNTDISQVCPSGIPCSAYVDEMNVPISWPINVPAHRTAIVFWNNSPNILNTPSCSLTPSAGSVSDGQTVDVSWNVTNSLSQIIDYPTAMSGSIHTGVSSSGSITFEPPSDGIATVSLETLNDI